MLPTFNYATVESVLAQIGARFVRRGTADRPALDVISPTIAAPRSCSAIASARARPARRSASRRCGTGPKPRPARLPAAIQAFNQRYAFSRAYLTADGRPALQRYLTADYGFVRGNLAVNLLVFAERCRRSRARAHHPPRGRFRPGRADGLVATSAASIGPFRGYGSTWPIGASRSRRALAKLQGQAGLPMDARSSPA